MYMKKNYKKNVKKNYKRMDLLEDLKISLLNFNFVMIYIVHKVLILIKSNLNYLKNCIFECFFKEYNRLFNFFFITYNNGEFKP